MQCEQFERVLEEQWSDGALPQPALAHLEECAACRALAADLRAIHDLARELGAEGIAPPERVWVSLRNHLEAENLIVAADDNHSPHSREPQIGSARPNPGWWVALQRPAFAGTTLALILSAALAVSYRWSSPRTSASSRAALMQEVSPVPSADSVFKEEVLTVGSDETPGSQRRDGAVASSIRRDLQIVDNFIAMCEKSVREQPDNQLAREYLYGAYQQKAELLATAMNRSMSGGVQ